MPRSRLLLPLALALGTLAVPAAADADFSSRLVSPTRVTFTGTDSAETLQISLDGALFRHDQPGDPFDFDSTLPGRQSIAPADVRTLFTAIGRGGDDRILLLTPEASLSADGGDGADVVIGSDDRDVLLGGSGDDLVAGRGTTDSIDLGPGDDRYEGSAKTGGNDRVEGREGDDTALLVGTGEADELSILGAATAFEVEMLSGGDTQIRDVETLELDLLGGDDVLQPELIPATLRFDVEGGPGNDSLPGGAGNDRVDGGDGDDQVFGGAGDDVLRGESVGGGPGNDSRTLDAGARPILIAEDDDGYDVTRLVTSGGADSLSLSQDNSGVRVEGAAAGKAFAAVGVGDAFVLETRAGDDSATVLPGAGRFSTIAVDGGDGADVLRGSEGVEWLAGALGDDVLDGGPGPDRLLAGGGDDLVRARDRAADAVDCGSGADLLLADPFDPPGGCEQLLPGPAAGPLALARVTATDMLRLDDPGVVEVPVTCSQGARGGCAGTLVLGTADAVTIGDAQVPVRLGSRTFTLAPGTTAQVAVSVDKADLVRAVGGLQLDVDAQVVTAVAEHTAMLPMTIRK